MADGRSAGVWNGQRAIKNPLLALDTLYSGLNLTPAIAFNSEFISTSSGVNTRVTSAYVNNDQFIQRTDVGDNKTIEKKITRTFNDNGFLSSEQVDMGDNGSIDNTTTYNFDAATGNLLSIEAGARAADGSIKPAGRSVYSYNPSGWLIQEDRQFKADGEVNVRTSYSYDANGLSETVHRTNGTVDRSVAYKYDAQGNQTALEFDTNGDGTVD